METLGLSIAMCTYNGARYLREQLQSFAIQDRQPDELVIFDDGSTDETLEIVAAFARTSPIRVRVYTNKHTLGSTKNFECAIATCEGDVIVLADQDDVWYEDKLSLIEQEFVRDPDIGMVFSDAQVVDDELNPLAYRLWEAVGFDRNAQQRFRKNPHAVLLQRSIVTGATMAFRGTYKSVILPIAPAAPNSWIHDAWISLVIASSAPVNYIPKPLISYRQHSRNQIGARKISFLKDIRKRLVKAGARDYQKRRALAFKYRTILDHIKKLKDGGHYVRLGVVEMLEDKVRHVEARAEQAVSVGHKLTVIREEAMSGRYFRYSGGFGSIFKDLFSG